MNKERLEELKKIRLLYEVCFVDEYASAIDDVTADFDLLIKRVQELEQDVREWEIVNEQWEQINTQIAEQNKRYREAREIIEQVYKESYVINAYGYEDGYLDGLDTAINIIDESLEVSS